MAMIYDPTRFYLGTSGAESPLSACDAEMFTTVEDIAKDLRTGSGILKRYKQRKITHWRFTYADLWGKQREVFDYGLGRDDLLALYNADNEMSFVVPVQSVTNSFYTVRFALNSWNDQIRFRSGDSWRWRVMFELVQVS